MKKEPEVDVACLSQGEIPPFDGLLALSVLHMDTSDRIWVHLTNSLDLYRTV